MILGIYRLLEHYNLISHSEVTELSRSREKAYGFMWNGSMKLTLKNGVKCQLKMWHNFMDDDGEREWKPHTHSTEEYREAWRLEYISRDPKTPDDTIDASWHTIWIGNHVYISKTGFYAKPDSVHENLQKQIIDGTYDKTDVWQLC